MTEEMDRQRLSDLRVAERVIDRLAGHAHDGGMLVRAWHGPRQSRLYVSRWAGGSEPVSAGYVEVELIDGRPPSAPLRVGWYARTAHDRQTMVDLAARAGELLEESL